jgi:hypothetical protein
MFESKNIQVDGNRVLAKKSERGSSWQCIATFHHSSEIPTSTNSMAIKFAKSITI